jgi:hypothetical protein
VAIVSTVPFVNARRAHTSFSQIGFRVHHVMTIFIVYLDVLGMRFLAQSVRGR